MSNDYEFVPEYLYLEVYLPETSEPKQVEKEQESTMIIIDLFGDSDDES